MCIGTDGVGSTSRQSHRARERPLGQLGSNPETRQGGTGCIKKPPLGRAAAKFVESTRDSAWGPVAPEKVTIIRSAWMEHSI